MQEETPGKFWYLQKEQDRWKIDRELNSDNIVFFVIFQILWY